MYSGDYAVNMQLSVCLINRSVKPFDPIKPFPDHDLKPLLRDG